MKKTVILLILLLLAIGCQNVQADATDAPAPTTAMAEAPAAEPTSAPAEAPYALSFTAQTLDGETVTEEILGQYELTMVNVWASWCGPCRSELPALSELYGRLPENVNFLSVTVDDPGDLSDAKAILEENGCTFPCLDGQGSAGLMGGFLSRVMAIPTTLFLDSRGNEVGDWMLGVPQTGSSVTDAYLSEIQARLSQLSGK